MKKRITSAILLLAMLTSFTACGETSTGLKDTTDTNVPVETKPALPAGIEPNEYGETVHFLASDWGMYLNYFFAEENSGDAMDLALFNRKMKIEEHLGVTLTHEYCQGNQAQYPLVQKMVMSGDNTYQVVHTHCTYGTTGLISDELLADFNDISTIDLSAEWWNQNSNKNLAIGGHQYFAINDYMIPDPNVVLFNKDMITSYSLENPYDLVRNGEWTIDKMMEMMGKVTKDNGDGVWDLKDTYGFGAPNNWMLTPLLYSCGLTLVTQDDDGYYQFAMGDERAYNAAEKIRELLISPDTFIYGYPHDFNEKNSDITQSLNISTGRCLFNLCAMSNLHSHRETMVEYGILPYPKYDTAQDNYYSLDWSGLMCIPATANNLEMIGEVVELLGYYSSEEVLPAYYDIVLGEKLARDDDSKEMLDIIFDGITFDAGMNYFGFHTYMNYFWFLCDHLQRDSFSGYASFYAQYSSGAEQEIQDFNDIVEAID